MMKLPIEFEQKMIELLGSDGYEEYLQALEKDAISGLRVNNLKTSTEEFQEISPFGLTPVDWSPNGFYCEDGSRPSGHPYYYAGLYYLQEPSAMAPAAFLPVRPGERVLDMCAAPGGKTTELASKLQGQGLLVANDISPSRVKALQKNLENFGVANALVLSEDPRNLTSVFPEFFDKILIDAPCSGEGMFRKKGSMVKYWLENGPDFYSAIQRNLVLYGADMLKPGGYMLYSTCTFSPMEDEETLKWLLDQRPDMHLAELADFPGRDFGHPEWAEGCPEEVCKAARFWPHKVEGEGHFVALLRKDGELQPNTAGAGKAPAKVPEDALAFLKEIKWDWTPSRFLLKNDNLYYRPEGVPELGRLRVNREGLFLGICRKNRFEPVQALAMALKEADYPRTVNLSADDPRVVKYLKCESIDVETDKKGWYLVCVDHFPMGWAKSDGSRLKNKYNPNWRMM